MVLAFSLIASVAAVYVIREQLVVRPLEDSCGSCQHHDIKKLMGVVMSQQLWQQVVSLVDRLNVKSY